MNRSIKIWKQRPADWPEEPQLDRYNTSFGFCDLLLNGRELKTEWLYHGPKPVKVASKRKHRRPV